MPEDRRVVGDRVSVLAGWEDLAVREDRVDRDRRHAVLLRGHHATGMNDDPYGRADLEEQYAAAVRE
ncbi:hypothetical protein [Streptomyces sp. NPDC058667]|uniref:hypothetical protein n=1 Tax=Streptomyces sp. NPDC058667 TaxID=3346588 RepID=UPI00364F6444